MLKLTRHGEREFEEMLGLLQGHRRRFHHTLRFTLNRLFQKSLAGGFGDLPYLRRSNTRVLRETRSKLEWAKLASMAKAEAYDSPNPIIVFRFRGTERLLDGHHRCRHWLLNDHREDHTAIVLDIRG